MYLNLNQLRAFYTAAYFGSISIAAHKLMVTPPAVTMQIKILEKTLGTKLILRKGKSIRLSETGTVLLKKCGIIFRNLYKLEDWADTFSVFNQSTIQIGCTPSAAKYLVPPIIKTFHEKQPNLQIKMLQRPSPELIENVVNSSIEIAIIVTGQGDKKKKVKTRIFKKERLALIAAPDSTYISGKKISINKLSSIPLILQRKGLEIRAVLLDYFNKFNIKPKVKFELENETLIKELVKTDKGVCFLPFISIKHEVENGQLKVVKISEGLPQINYCIAYLKRSSLSSISESFINMFG
jgi:DNA-binding transcriptional LysR family regulator